MIFRIWSMLRARRAAMLEAEFLVMEFGAQGPAYARALASDPMASDARRAHYRRVAQIAARRHDLLRHLDTATRYDVVNEWRLRRGALCR